MVRSGRAKKFTIPATLAVAMLGASASVPTTSIVGCNSGGDDDSDGGCLCSPVTEAGTPPMEADGSATGLPCTAALEADHKHYACISFA
jgi:hypothetical protein